MPAGSGCRGPERIWPGLGAGTGFAGIAVPLGEGAGLAGTGIEGAPGTGVVWEIVGAGACALGAGCDVGGATRGGAA